jgi:hypothetical protein
MQQVDGGWWMVDGGWWIGGSVDRFSSFNCFVLMIFCGDIPWLMFGWLVVWMVGWFGG